MKQIHYIFTLLVVLMSSLQLKAQEKPANLWFQFDDRFTANDVMELKDVDSIAFTNKSLKLYRFYPIGCGVAWFKKAQFVYIYIPNFLCIGKQIVHIAHRAGCSACDVAVGLLG